MKTRQQRSDAAYSAVLAHISYASLEGETFETQLRELVIGLKVLCAEYQVDIDEVTVPESAADLPAGDTVIVNIQQQQRDTSGVPYPAWAWPQDQWCQETGESREVHCASVTRAKSAGKPVPDFNLS